MFVLKIPFTFSQKTVARGNSQEEGTVNDEETKKELFIFRVFKFITSGVHRVYRAHSKGEERELPTH